MNLSEPASQRWFVKVAPPPHYSMHPVFLVWTLLEELPVNPLYPVQT